MTANDGDDGFLARWSRRKAEAVRDERAPGAADAVRGEIARDAKAPARRGLAPAVVAPPADAPAVDAPAVAAPTAVAVPPRAAPAEAPTLTLTDVARLGRDSDYAPFVRAGVDPAVKNAALRKLFTDPRFNVMDGLDTYIDDYGKPDPIPPAMLRRLNQARSLGLFEADPDEIDGASHVEATAASPEARATPATGEHGEPVLPSPSARAAVPSGAAADESISSASPSTGTAEIAGDGEPAGVQSREP